MPKFPFIMKGCPAGGVVNLAPAGYPVASRHPFRVKGNLIAKTPINTPATAIFTHKKAL